jgi:hypothetical protein
MGVQSILKIRGVRKAVASLASHFENVLHQWALLTLFIVNLDRDIIVNLNIFRSLGIRVFLHL